MALTAGRTEVLLNRSRSCVLRTPMDPGTSCSCRFVSKASMTTSCNRRVVSACPNNTVEQRTAETVKKKSLMLQYYIKIAETFLAFYTAERYHSCMSDSTGLAAGKKSSNRSMTRSTSVSGHE